MAKSFTIVISDEEANYSVIQFLSILAKGVNANDHISSVEESASGDGKWYAFDATDFTEEQCDALSRLLVEVYNRPDIAIQIQ